MSESVLQAAALTQSLASQTDSYTEVINNINTLINNRKSLHLSTIDSHTGLPLASYSPFIIEDFKLYILVSELAQHTQNLIATKRAGVMLIEDENQTINIFARKRLVLECKCKALSTKETQGQQLLSIMQERLGPTVGLLKTLPDFHMFELTPINGHYVQGFGQAYRLEASSEESG